MRQYIRSVRVEYVVRISFVMGLYIGHWKVFGKISRAETGRLTDRIAFTKTETHFYKLRIKSTHVQYTPGLVMGRPGTSNFQRMSGGPTRPINSSENRPIRCPVLLIKRACVYADGIFLLHCCFFVFFVWILSCFWPV